MTHSLEHALESHFEGGFEREALELGEPRSHSLFSSCLSFYYEKKSSYILIAPTCFASSWLLLSVLI